MGKLELGRVIAVLIHQFCVGPDVLDVTLADRFGEQVVAVTIPTIDEHDAVSSTVPDSFRSVRVHIIPLFGIGSFTGKSKETLEVLSLIYEEPYNVYGTPENRKLKGLMDEVMVREREIWSSMDSEKRRDAIRTEIKEQRASRGSEFGNCWSL